MALVQFQVPYPISWGGKTYLTGLQSIPEDLATALGWSLPRAEESLPEVLGKSKRPTRP